MMFTIFGVIVMIVLFAGLLKLFIINYDQLTEEEKEDIAKAFRDRINNGTKIDSI
jgi:hypothetical protein